MPIYTEAQKSKIVSEVFNSEKIQLICGKHNYAAGKIPPKTRGCAQCWYSYFVWDIATTPPHLRKERLDELEAVIMHTAEYEDKGVWSGELFEPGDPRFQTSIEPEPLIKEK